MPLNRRRLLADRKLLGRWGEKRCEKFLKRRGYRTLSRNYSCRTGEIDLVMVDHGGAIVFVEVKTRSGEDFTAAEEVVTAGKKTKLAKTARYFLSTNNLERRPCRFDVVTVILEDHGPEQIRHYENAFVP